VNIRILGAHNCETKDVKCASILVDDVMAIDAGGLTSSLSIAAQTDLKVILITHYHYDHIKDIPLLAMNLSLNGLSVGMYAPSTVLEELTTHFFNGDIYPKFLEQPPGKPTLRYTALMPMKEHVISGYHVLPIDVDHSVPAVGYQITSHDEKKLFYTGDTGVGIGNCWEYVSPQLLVVEVTMPNRFESSAKKNHHLTPDLLKQTLVKFRETKGYLPKVLGVHMNPYLETDLRREVANVSQELNTEIELTQEGMQYYL